MLTGNPPTILSSVLLSCLRTAVAAARMQAMIIRLFMFCLRGSIDWLIVEEGRYLNQYSFACPFLIPTIKGLPYILSADIDEALKYFVS